MRLKPNETKNLIFVDTEFSDLDPYKGEILSVGIVKLNGDELYLELEHDGDCSDWVKKHILPTLNESKVSRLEACKQIASFIGKTNPFLVAFVDNYDHIYLTKLFGSERLPYRWLTIDFASILFAMGVNPVKFWQKRKGLSIFIRNSVLISKNIANIMRSTMLVDCVKFG